VALNAFKGWVVNRFNIRQFKNLRYLCPERQHERVLCKKWHTNIEQHPLGNMTLHIDQKDLKDMAKVELLIRMIDSQDQAYFGKVLDEMHQFQPFLLSVLLGYQFDLTPLQHEKAIKIFALIWEYFADRENLRKKQIREENLEHSLANNIRTLERFGKETSSQSKNAVLADDMARINAKGLYMAIFHMVSSDKVFETMGIRERAYLLMGLKNIIECMEAM
jgi:hypothetical protein